MRVMDPIHALAGSPVRKAPRLSLSPADLTAVVDEGSALERLGNLVEARSLYERVLESGKFVAPPSIARLERLVARTYRAASDYDAANLWAQRALATSEAADDHSGCGHAINVLATISLSKGDLDDAEELFLQARKSALTSNEPRLAAMTATNLGSIATVRGNHDDALMYHESALADARGAGLGDEAMWALNNLGLLHTQMSRFDLAQRSYDEALLLGRTLGDLSACTRALVNVSRLLIRQGDYEGARKCCDEATELATQLGDTSADGEAAQIYGVIERAAGRFARAEEYFLRAESVAIERGDLILQGETARELAELYRAQNRNRQVLKRLNQSHRLFAQLRARHELADIDERTHRLEGDFLDVARKWGESIESKDRYTQGHCVRVADLACALWRRVSQEDDAALFWFRIGALLHDVGKLMVPEEVLNKPGKLDDAEWALMRRHPTAGVELLADIEFPWDVRPLIESHHERWDGKGYPHGVAGEDIPMTARVLCIADVYDALTSLRSYKKAWTHDEAMGIMRTDVGKAFDPALFEAFEEIVRRGTWRHTPAGSLQVVW